MFGPLGIPELLFILVLALLIFGPKRLPEVGRTLGRGMSEFRKASNELKRTVNAELALEEEPTPPQLRPYRVEPPVPAPIDQVQEPRTETPPEESRPLGPH
jgi:sec-independent protein translocase protein TatA